MTEFLVKALEKSTMVSALGEICIEALAGGGCPQEGVLSPLVWAILIDSFLNRLTNEGLYCLGYANNIVVLLKGRFNVMSEQM